MQAEWNCTYNARRSEGEHMNQGDYWTRRRALRLAAGSAGALGTAGVAACGAPSEQANTASAAPTTISFTTDWDNNVARQGPMKEALAMFAQRNPRITISKTDLAGGTTQAKFASSLAAGTYDDVVLLGSPQVPYYRDLGTFVDIAPLLKTAKIDMKTFTYVDPSHSVGNKRFFLPFQQGGSIWTVNKTLFQKEGVPLPNENWTWNDWADAGRKLSKPDQDQYGFGPALDDDLKAKYYPLIGSNGGHVISPDFKRTLLTDSPTLEAIRWGAERMTRDRSWVQPGAPKTVDFTLGNVGMLISSANIGNTIQKVGSKFEWDLMPQPKSPRTGKSVRTFNAQPHGITTKSTGGAARVEAAFTFVAFMSGRDVQLLIAKDKGSVPVLRELITTSPYADPPPASMKLVAKDLDDAMDLRLFNGYDEWQSAWTTALQDVWTGKMSVEAGVKIANDAADGVLARVTKK
jgi:multiple sugar transport system substrate-binding protein